MKFAFWKRKEESGKQRIHLDYASTTPVAQEVYDAMLPYFNQVWANPNSIYQEGVKARRVVEEARIQTARTLGIRANDVIFTSGGTEANNLALFGYIESLHTAGRSYDAMEIISTPIEHPSILKALELLKQRGVKVAFARVHEDGLIDTESLASLLKTQTVLVTFAYANSEIGTIQHVRDISRLIAKHNKSSGTEVRMHLDASQAPLWLPCELETLGVDMMTIDASKCYGPKGIGVLAVRHWVTLTPLLVGGGQEHGLRSGTENVPLIVGLARSFTRAQERWKERSERITSLRNHLAERILSAIPEAVLNGSISSRIANNVNISIPGIDTEYAVIVLDTEGIAASTKSACGARESSGSQVVRACTHDDARALATIRFTLGEETKEEELDRVVEVLKFHVERTSTWDMVLK